MDTQPDPADYAWASTLLAVLATQLRDASEAIQRRQLGKPALSAVADLLASMSVVYAEGRRWAAEELCENFAVIPHAKWLAQKRRINVSPALREARSRAGKSKSLRKALAARENGRIGGRSRRNYRQFAKALLTDIASARSKNPPDENRVRILVADIPLMSRRLRTALYLEMKEQRISPPNLYLPSHWKPRSEVNKLLANIRRPQSDDPAPAVAPTSERKIPERLITLKDRAPTRKINQAEVREFVDP